MNHVVHHFIETWKSTSKCLTWKQLVRIRAVFNNNFCARRKRFDIGQPLWFWVRSRSKQISCLIESGDLIVINFTSKDDVVAQVQRFGLLFKIFSGRSLTLTDNLYTATVYSYTKQVNNDISVDKRFISSDDKVLIIDDFLANGQAVQGLMEIAKAANVEIAGVGVVIEKSFQKGHQMVVDAGLHLEALASVASLENNQVTFMSDKK